MNQSARRIRLLLVDDEEDFVNSLARSLGRRGFDVETALQGREAMEMLARRHFDVAILDMKMPGMDGEELFSIIKKRWPTTPVIMLTGHGSVNQAFRTSREGIYDYMTKPCDVEMIARMARQAAGHVNTPLGRAVEEMSCDIRVLLVDDDEELLRGLHKALSRRGFVVSMARDGEEALLRIRDETFDVVVLDIRMPGLDGLDVLRCIKNQSLSPDVLLLTGHASVHTAFEGMSLGAYDYLLKPHDVEELVSKIRSAFHSQGKKSTEENPPGSAPPAPPRNGAI